MNERVKQTLQYIINAMILLAALLFGILFVVNFENSFVEKHEALLLSLYVILLVSAGILWIVFKLKEKGVVYKSIFTAVSLIAMAAVFLFIIERSGLLYKMSSKEALQEMILKIQPYSSIVFVLLQIFQVLFLPIPSALLTGVGASLFGYLFGSFLSLFGILCGSTIAFWIGRKLGHKIVIWLIGEETYDKCLRMIKGRDKYALTVMFLLPFFPDDALCFISGLTTMPYLYFIIVMLISRSIIIFSTSFMFDMVPITEWWGILIWAVLILGTLILFYIAVRYGNKIDEWISKVIKKKH